MEQTPLSVAPTRMVPNEHWPTAKRMDVPSPPERIPPGLLALFIQQLDGRSGSTGGAAVIPTDATVANSAVSQTVSGDLSQSLQ